MVDPHVHLRDWNDKNKETIFVIQKERGKYC